MLKRTAARGYGGKHQRERERWRRRVEAGLIDCHANVCVESSRWIAPGTPWDLGHTDDRKGYTGPEHSTCNRRAGGRNGAAVTNAMRTQGRQTSRDW